LAFFAKWLFLLSHQKVTKKQTSFQRKSAFECHIRPLKRTLHSTISRKETLIKVKVLKLGHSARQSEVPAGSTVSDVLAKADLDSTGYSVTANGLGVSLGAAVSDADVIYLVPKIEGDTA